MILAHIEKAITGQIDERFPITHLWTQTIAVPKDGDYSLRKQHLLPDYPRWEVEE